MVLKEIKGVVAIPPSEAKDVGKLTGNRELTGEQLDAFREAGWRFVPTVDTKELAEDPAAASFHEVEIVEQPQEIRGASRHKALHPRPVYRDSAGQVVIAGAAIVVRFHEHVDEDMVHSLLDKHDLRIKRRLGFVKNGYQVIPASSESSVDLFEVSTRLAEEDAVEYAEPATVEVMKKRRGGEAS